VPFRVVLLTALRVYRGTIARTTRPLATLWISRASGLVTAPVRVQLF